MVSQIDPNSEDAVMVSQILRLRMVNIEDLRMP